MCFVHMQITAISIGQSFFPPQGSLCGISAAQHHTQQTLKAAQEPETPVPSLKTLLVLSGRRKPERSIEQNAPR